MKKAIVIGCPGSGKSTFARRLSLKTGLPVVHLDMLNWNADKTTVPKSVFLERLNNAMAEDFWIIDGNYKSTMEQRIQKCDTVFFLDYPVEICLKGIEERQGKPRPDMPWIENEKDEAFLSFVHSYQDTNRPAVMDLMKKYQDKKWIVFHTRKEAEAWLNK